MSKNNSLSQVNEIYREKDKMFDEPDTEIYIYSTRNRNICFQCSHILVSFLKIHFSTPRIKVYEKRSDFLVTCLTPGSTCHVSWLLRVTLRVTSISFFLQSLPHSSTGVFLEQYFFLFSGGMDENFLAAYRDPRDKVLCLKLRIPSCTIFSAFHYILAIRPPQGVRTNRGQPFVI